MVMQLAEILKIAQELATNAHKEQTDKAGKPYINHCEAVAAQLVVCQLINEKLTSYN